MKPEMREGRRPAGIALQSFVLGLLAILFLQLLVRLPLNWLLAFVFLWFSLKTVMLFILLRPGRSTGHASRIPTLNEIGLITISNLVLMLLAGGLAALLDHSLMTGVATAVALYSLGYVALSRRLQWHPFAAG